MLTEIVITIENGIRDPSSNPEPGTSLYVNTLSKVTNPSVCPAIDIYIYIYIYIPNPPLGHDMTQGQFLSLV